jgi:type IV pilus assembly protein PilQ
MQKWTKTAGLLFIAAASVYTSQAIVAATGSGASSQSLAVASPALKPVIANTRQAPGDVLMGAPGDNTDATLTTPADAAPADAPTTAPSASDSTATDPFASAPTTAPSSATADAGTGADSASTQPSEGRSVSSSEVSVNDAGTVELHVNDANLVEVLRMLSLQSQRNIIASKDVHGTVTANLYDVTVREALDAILHANGYAYREKGNFIYVYTTKEIADMEKAERHTDTRVFHVYYTSVANAQNMLKPLLSKDGQLAASTPAKVGISSTPTGGSGDDYANNDTIVVTDYPENLDKIAKTLAEIDKRPQQILLEATIAQATLDENNALGVDFNIMGGVDMAGLVNGGSQIVGSGVVDPAGTGSTVLPENGVTPQGRVHSVGTGNAFTSGINGGLKVGYVTDSVSLFLAALEQTTDTTILANPKVLALNKQQGEVLVGREDGYLTTVTTETTSTQSVETLKTGVHLLFRPFIGDDGYIRMEVHPEDSDGTVNTKGLPQKSTTEVTSNIMVKDGHTIVIGGLFRESTVSGRNQVPFLGNLPLAGALFRNQTDHTVRQEIIILLTPHIVKDDVSYSKLSEDELKRAEDLRVGARKGLMPWGRERLAEGWYEAAKREMAKPHPDRTNARWDLDAAMNLNPHFTEAMQLREQVTGHEITAADGSSIRSFVRRAIMSDVVPSTQPTTTAQDDVDGKMTAAEPTTPVDDETTAEAPATQPAIADDQTAEAPTTQPDEMTAEAPTTQPDQATASTDDSYDTGADDEAMQEDESPAASIPGTESASVSDDSAAVPSTQPAEAQAQTDGSEVAPIDDSQESQPMDEQSADTTPANSEATDAVPTTQPGAVDNATAQTDQAPIVDEPSNDSESAPAPQQ